MDAWERKWGLQSVGIKRSPTISELLTSPCKHGLLNNRSVLRLQLLSQHGGCLLLDEYLARFEWQLWHHRMQQQSPDSSQP